MIAVRIAGSGGQGIQRAGVALAEAAVRGGLNAICAQTYGPESRGGASRADVIVSEDEIVYPRVQHPDILIALSTDAYRQFAPTLRPGGLLIADSSAAESPPAHAVAAHVLPITATARALGSALAANVVALGVLAALRPLVDREVLEAALRSRIHADALRIRRALLAGMALAQAGTPQPGGGAGA